MARQPLACDSRGKCLRRRGPRSQMARLRRSVPKSRRTLPGISLRESRALIPADVDAVSNLPCEDKRSSNQLSTCMLEDRDSNLCQNGIFVYSVNIQCILAHVAELEHHLHLHQPHIVMIQEIWLNASTEHIKIENYKEVSRRDRKKTENRGGILTLQRQDFNGLVHIKDCDEEERSWHFLNLGAEIFLIANWYRPGASVHDGFVRLHQEIAGYFQECSGVLIVGDLNVHHKRWLRYSNDNTQVGADLNFFAILME